MSMVRKRLLYGTMTLIALIAAVVLAVAAPVLSVPRTPPLPAPAPASTPDSLPAPEAAPPRQHADAPWRRAIEPTGARVIADRSFSSTVTERGRAEHHNGWVDYSAGGTSRLRIAPDAGARDGSALEFVYPVEHRSGTGPAQARRPFDNGTVPFEPRSIYVEWTMWLSPRWQSHWNANKLFYLYFGDARRGSGRNAVLVFAPTDDARLYSDRTAAQAGDTAARRRAQEALQTGTLRWDFRPNTSPWPSQRPSTLGASSRPGARLERGQWQRWAMRLDLGTPGQRDGRVRMWQITDGRAVSIMDAPYQFLFEDTPQRWVEVGFRPVWGGAQSGVDYLTRSQVIRIGETYIAGAP
jgi:hypothetical protein